MRGVGSMITTMTLVTALACQGCAQHNSTYASAPVVVRAHQAQINFLDETALDAGIAPATPSSYNAYEVIPNSFNTPLYGEPLAITGQSFETDSAYSAVFSEVYQPLHSLEWSANEGVELYKADRKSARLTEPMEIERNFSAELSLSAPGEQTGLDFDLGIAPRLSLQNEGDFEKRSFGAEVRLGQALDARGSIPAGGWYIFAGADDEALVWETGDRGFTDMGAMRLRDQITVGDLQAGFAVHRGGGQLSLSYIRREVEYHDRNGGYSENEDFAGVSFTLKR